MIFDYLTDQVTSLMLTCQAWSGIDLETIAGSR